MTPEDISTLFAEASERFAAIVGQPTDADIHELRECLFPILLDIPYDQENGKHNLVGIIADAADYRNNFGIAFVQPGQKKAYDNVLNAAANNVVRAKGGSSMEGGNQRSTSLRRR